MLQWALGLKPGDLINDCFHWPYNTKVASTSVVYWPYTGGLRGYTVEFVEITGEDGRLHQCDGTGNCVTYPFTPARIREVILAFPRDHLQGFLKEKVAQGWCTDEGVRKALQEYDINLAGGSTCTPEGLRLEF
jgi:hypothetical protein